MWLHTDSLIVGFEKYSFNVKVILIWIRKVSEF